MEDETTVTMICPSCLDTEEIPLSRFENMGKGEQKCVWCWENMVSAEGIIGEFGQTEVD
jgi:hypothetical protein